MARGTTIVNVKGKTVGITPHHERIQLPGRPIQLIIPQCSGHMSVSHSGLAEYIHGLNTVQLNPETHICDRNCSLSFSVPNKRG